MTPERAQSSPRVFDLPPGGARHGCVCLVVLTRQIAHAVRLVGKNKVCRTLRACMEALDRGDGDSLDAAAARISRDCDR